MKNAIYLQFLLVAASIAALVYLVLNEPPLREVPTRFTLDDGSQVEVDDRDARDLSPEEVQEAMNIDIQPNRLPPDTQRPARFDTSGTETNYNGRAAGQVETNYGAGAGAPSGSTIVLPQNVRNERQREQLEGEETQYR